MTAVKTRPRKPWPGSEPNTEYEQEEWDGFSRIPMERWGKDHVTTVLFAETRCVDYRGAISHARMRTTHHNGHLLSGSFGHEVSEYPTRIKPSEEAIEAARLRQTAGEQVATPVVCELWGHDDWDCLADAHHFGLLVVTMSDLDLVSVEMTEAGERWCMEHRSERADRMRDGDVVESRVEKLHR